MKACTRALALLGAALACVPGVAPAQTTPAPEARPAQPAPAARAPAADRADGTRAERRDAPAAGERTPVVDAAQLEEGANSFTEGQARSRFEDAGFADVRDLRKDDRGFWRGRASRQGGGGETDVAMDFRGRIAAGPAVATLGTAAGTTARTGAGATPGTAADRRPDGAPGNPPSTATGRAVDRVQGETPRADGTPGNPPGTAAGRALDRATGANTTGANPPAAAPAAGPAR